jgi:hypothetical protein
VIFNWHWHYAANRAADKNQQQSEHRQQLRLHFDLSALLSKMSNRGIIYREMKQGKLQYPHDEMI